MLKSALKRWIHSDEKEPKEVQDAEFKEIKKSEVRKLTQLTEAITKNSTAVAQKYDELRGTGVKLIQILDKFEKEKFDGEIAEINSLATLSEEEKKEFSESFDVIRKNTIEELRPVVHDIQRVQAHMLVTLQKATHKKVALTVKTAIIQNAAIQLDVLKGLDRETQDISNELRILLGQLEAINRDALKKYDTFAGEVENLTGGKGNIVQHIMDKYDSAI